MPRIAGGAAARRLARAGPGVTACDVDLGTIRLLRKMVPRVVVAVL